MPTFDMRDFVLLHTPILWIASHALAATVCSAVLVLSCLVGIIIAAIFLPDIGLLLLLSFAFCVSGAFLLTSEALRRGTTAKGYDLLQETRLPDMPLRGEYAEGLVARGLFAEIVWGLQVMVALIGLVVPGVLELSYPGVGEIILLVIVGLIVQAKFTSSLCTRIHRVVNPLWKGCWTVSANGTTKTYSMMRTSR